MGVTLLAFGTTAVAVESGFSGRWRADIQSLKLPESLDHYLLTRGKFYLGEGRFAKSIEADGKFHKFADRYCPESSVKIVDRFHVRQECRENGASLFVTDFVVSKNGRMLEAYSISWSGKERLTVKSGATRTRVGAPKPNVHLLSGTWKITRLTLPEDGSADWILRLNGDRFSSKSPSGNGYDAIFNGPAVKLVGDLPGATVYVVRQNQASIVETVQLDGKATGRMTMRYDASKDMIHVSSKNLADNTITNYDLRRINSIK